MDTELKEWVQMMEQEEPNVLADVNLQAISGIANICLLPQLLMEAARYWDPNHHVFRFGTAEICPTYEEYGACLKYRPRPAFSPASVVYKPPEKIHHVKDVQTFFQVEKAEAVKMIVAGMVDLPTVIEKFKTKGPSISQRQRNNAFLFCVLARYLLRTNGKNGAIAIIHLIPQLRDGCDIIPVILSETFAGLDHVKNKGSKNFHLLGGSPHLLQLWLAERLKLNRPLKRPLFLWKHYATRGNVKKLDWKTKLARIHKGNIRWTVSWWNTDVFITNTRKSQYVQLIGLSHTSFYQPQRIMKQYGMPPEEHPRELPPPPGKEVDEAVYQEYKAAWIKRKIHRKPPI